MNFVKVSKLFLYTAALAALAQSTYAQSFGYAVMPSTAAPGEARSHAWVASSISPAATVRGPGKTCGVAENLCYYFPSDLVSAYAISSIAHGNGGSGITVAIVDAFYNSQT